MNSNMEYQWPPKIPTEQGARRAWLQLYEDAWHYADAHIPPAFRDLLDSMDSVRFLGAEIDRPDEHPEVCLWFGYRNSDNNEFISAKRTQHIFFPSTAALELIQNLEHAHRGCIARLLILRHIAEEELELEPDAMGLFEVWKLDQRQVDRVTAFNILKLRGIYEQMLFGADGELVDERDQLFADPSQDSQQD